MCAPSQLLRPVLRPVGQARDAAGLFRRLRRDRAWDCPGGTLPPAPVEVGSEAGLQQDPVGHRRRPRDLLDAVQVFGVGRRLGRARRAAALDPAGQRLSARLDILRPRRSRALALLVPEEVELVARRDLPRQAQARDRPAGIVARLSGQVRLVGPRVGDRRRSGWRTCRARSWRCPRHARSRSTTAGPD